MSEIEDMCPACRRAMEDRAVSPARFETVLKDMEADIRDSWRQFRADKDQPSDGDSPQGRIRIPD